MKQAFGTENFSYNSCIDYQQCLAKCFHLVYKSMSRSSSSIFRQASKSNALKKFSFLGLEILLFSTPRAKSIISLVRSEVNSGGLTWTGVTGVVGLDDPSLDASYSMVVLETSRDGLPDGALQKE